MVNLRTRSPDPFFVRPESDSHAIGEPLKLFLTLREQVILFTESTNPKEFPLSTHLWLIRHGETAWSLSGAHTGRTDIPLTANGEQQALAIGERLRGVHFSLVLTSPLKRARETCRLAGFAESALLDDHLMEWDYGVYESLSTAEIRESRPGWNLWADGVPSGESALQVADRAQLVIDRALSSLGPEGGDVALFAHGHLLRILAATWLGLAPECGRLFALSTATVSVLGLERNTRVITRWNMP